MLHNFIIAVEAVLPTFLIILLGIGAQRLHIMTTAELSHANKAVFQVMFPIMMFYNIYSADFSGVILPGYFAFCLITLFAVYFLGVIVTLLVEKDNFNRGALIQAIYRGNLVLLGLPIMQNLLGEEAVGLTTIMLAMIVPIYNVLAVITLEVFRGGDIHIVPLLKKILKNPMIMGALAGILGTVSGLELPGILTKPIGQIASSATPVALLLMGASFHFSSIRENLRDLIIGVTGKLIISPAIALTAGYFLGFRGIPLALLIIIFGAPCAVSGYTMAQQMDSNGDLAAGCLIFTSLFSCVTICFWIFLFKQLGAI